MDVLAVLDRQLRDRADRAARYGKQADKAAAKHGARQVTADRMAEHARIQLEELRSLRAPLIELQAAARASLAARDLADQIAADDRLRASLAACEPETPHDPV
ncbi:hypothetical protein JY419_02170 [Stenotrophomonas maltophilia]|nr:hypothetical protein [Stenotrophomonas maltophilia]